MKVDVRKLKNGIPVLMENIENINTVSLGIFVKTGAKDEKLIEDGVSHFLEHMMFKGTTNRSAKDISEEIDNEGGMINAYTSRETTVYYIQMLSERLTKGVDILADMFLNSTFTDENLEKERNVIIEEIRMYEDIPEEVIHEENIRFALGGPQGKNVLGTVESLKKIDRKILSEYFYERYCPENIVISVAGRIKEDELFNQLNETFGNLKGSEKTRDIDYKMSINNGEHLIKQETNQIHLCFNTKGVSLLDKYKYPVAIIINVLGGNMSARLFQKIREERGLAYSVYGYSSSFEEGGLFTIYAGTTKENYKEVLDLIKEEFEDIKENGITEYELQKSKNQFLSMFTFGLESSKGKMNRMANSYMLYGEVKDVEESIEKVESITLEDIKEAAKEIFNEKYYSQTILGDI
ncbi:Predicted Zn-dependent peptidase [Cetobacterium ceti]|uniref:Predicted Zn-dependent peptidase n=1 Tax=Cetobacterium ceti TaxID=180163 RepID=A0A1T4KVL6_9FUSO|nr:pitrilysin family protein [Cetobacterium ceti]SJZ46436.1 Predicted Zn-dependent peptidase [Cetobacterium ceti]